MLSNTVDCVRSTNLPEPAYLESLIRADYEHCHPGETLEDMKRRALFSKEHKRLLGDWMAVAVARAAARRATAPLLIAAE
jgi:hypothetical protein